MSNNITNRIDFMFVFDVINGNPNGDPNFNNQPRQNIETGLGLVTDGCMKRKIRNYIQIQHPDLGIYVKQGESLELKQKGAYDALGIDPVAADDDSESEASEAGDKKKATAAKNKGKRVNKTDEANARAHMCKNFFDIRAFGAVMGTTSFRCGQVMGPVQITMSESFHRIDPTEVAIGRVCYTTEDKTQKSAGSSEMGSKWIVPYGMYRGYGTVSVPFARDIDKGGTGFSKEDLDIFFEALKHAFDFDKSATRPMMNMHQIYVWTHNSGLGNAPQHRLIDSVESKIQCDSDAPSSFKNYTLPAANEISAFPGVTLTTLI